jgi:ataxia telangiectasia mutated family protein
MYKVALLFAELAFSEGGIGTSIANTTTSSSSRSSRRSSALREAPDSFSSNEILLEIFENIDDPDAYYGLTQDASLSTVLARLEYENDGSKSLAFRGAQYDAHLRSRNYPASKQDSQALIKALSSLGLSGLSNSLLQQQHQDQQSSGSGNLLGAGSGGPLLLTSTSNSASPSASASTSLTLDATFTTARRLEMWNLPAPAVNHNWAVTVYKAYQSMHQATDIKAVKAVIHDGLRSTIQHLTGKGLLNTSSMRHQFAALAALAELSELVDGVQPTLKNNGVVAAFEERSKWMMSGR